MKKLSLTEQEKQYLNDILELADSCESNHRPDCFPDITHLARAVKELVGILQGDHEPEEDEEEEEEPEEGLSCKGNFGHFKWIYRPSNQDIEFTAIYRKIGRIEGMLDAAMMHAQDDCLDVLEELKDYIKESF